MPFIIYPHIESVKKKISANGDFYSQSFIKLSINGNLSTFYV